MTAPNKDSEWFKKRCKKGCQICGTKLQGKNNGLEWSHIISQNDKGGNDKINCMALCPNCAYAFDYIIKPAIFKASKKYSNRQIPSSWKVVEGRAKSER